MGATAMTRAFATLLTTGLLAMFADASSAQGQTTPAKLEKGDIIHLDVQLDLNQKSRVGSRDDKPVCFRSGSAFDVVHADDTVTYFKRRHRWTVSAERERSLNLDCNDADLSAAGDDLHVYAIDNAALKPDFYRHFGITHGALFVPFKRRSDKSLSGESNLGYYLGYRFGGPLGVAITPAGSVGMSLVNVNDDSATTATSVRDSGTRAAFTWTVGFILTHLDAFQVGVFVGKDRIGGDAGSVWKYENKPWVSVAFGYAFTR